MDEITRSKVKEIILKEIEIEDDMLDLYSILLAKEPFLEKLAENDLNVVKESINILLRDTRHHKEIMHKVINQELI